MITFILISWWKREEALILSLRHTMQKQKNQLFKGNNIKIIFYPRTYVYVRSFRKNKRPVDENENIEYYFKALEIQLDIIFSKWNQRNRSISNSVSTIHSVWSPRRKFGLKFSPILIWMNGKNSSKNFDRNTKVRGSPVLHWGRCKQKVNMNFRSQKWYR